MHSRQSRASLPKNGRMVRSFGRWLASGRRLSRLAAAAAALVACAGAGSRVESRAFNPNYPPRRPFARGGVSLFRRSVGLDLLAAVVAVEPGFSAVDETAALEVREVVLRD